MIRSRLAFAANFTASNNKGEDNKRINEISDISGACHLQIDDSSYLKVRSNLIQRDMDITLVTEVTPEVKMTVGCGFDFKEVDIKKKDALYSEPYFGVKFDV